MMRMTRAAPIGVLAIPFIEMAKLQGVSPFGITTRHALPNALAPIIKRGRAEPRLSDRRCRHCRGGQSSMIAT
jgi:ABC-type antimicrobial peptide transport system permease subunit